MKKILYLPIIFLAHISISGDPLVDALHARTGIPKGKVKEIVTALYNFRKTRSYLQAQVGKKDFCYTTETLGEREERNCFDAKSLCTFLKRYIPTEQLDETIFEEIRKELEESEIYIETNPRSDTIMVKYTIKTRTTPMRTSTGTLKITFDKENPYRFTTTGQVHAKYDLSSL